MIQKDMGEIFQRETNNLLEGKMVTVTVVRVAADFSLAKVYVSIFPSHAKDDIIEIINENKKHFRHQLSIRIKNQLKKMPELAFFIDDSLDYIEHIENLIKK